MKPESAPVVVCLEALASMDRASLARHWEQVFDCPASKFIGTAAKSDYEYIPGLSESSAPTEVIIYDRDGNHNNLGRNVVRVNGSVEWVHSTEGKPR